MTRSLASGEANRRRLVGTRSRLIDCKSASWRATEAVKVLSIGDGVTLELKNPTH